MRKSLVSSKVFQILQVSVNLWYSAILYKNINFSFYSVERHPHSKKKGKALTQLQQSKLNIFSHLISLDCHRH